MTPRRPHTKITRNVAIREVATVMRVELEPIPVPFHFIVSEEVSSHWAKFRIAACGEAGHGLLLSDGQNFEAICWGCIQALGVQLDKLAAACRAEG